MKDQKQNLLTNLFVACGLILLPSGLLLIVISCKICNSSMKFKFIHKIAVIHKKFRALSNLLRGPDKTPSGAGSGPRAAGCASCPIGSNERFINYRWLKAASRNSNL